MSTDKVMFQKIFAKYYHKWYRDSLDSIKYCQERGKNADEYREAAEHYKEIIDKYPEEIEFFSQNDNAFKIDRVLPEKFRGY